MAQKAEAAGDGLVVLLQQQFAGPGAQLALQNDDIEKLFHKITPVQQIIAWDRLSKNSHILSKRLFYDKPV